LSSSVNRK